MQHTGPNDTRVWVRAPRSRGGLLPSCDIGAFRAAVVESDANRTASIVCLLGGPSAVALAIVLGRIREREAAFEIFSNTKQLVCVVAFVQAVSQQSTFGSMSKRESCGLTQVDKREELCMWVAQPAQAPRNRSSEKGPRWWAGFGLRGVAAALFF